MLQYFLDTFSTLGLRARYQRLIHERLLSFTEHASPTPVSEEPGDWQPLGGNRGFTEPQRTDLRQRARQLAQKNAHARNILRLLQSYVTGPGLKLILHPRNGAVPAELLERAQQLWQQFCTHNERHYSFSEHARRTWRDGECFIRKFSTGQWPPAVRYVDPELIGPTADTAESQGIITAAHDVETPVEYLKIDPLTGLLAEAIPAQHILHTRIGVDSNEKRGVTVLSAVLDTLDCFDKWVETELHARKLQSSIVLWRKVQGSPQQTGALADTGAGGTGTSGSSGLRRERFQPGTILTTNQGTDIQFLQPNTNFGDAVPLGRMLLLTVAAGAGLPEFMLTSDASNSNYASTMVAEGPAVKLFQTEQQFFAQEFSRLWRWVMQEAIDQHLLPDDFLDQVEIDWTFPQLINRDRPAERLADVKLVEAGILSRAEVARREGVDPARMEQERSEETSE